MAVVNVHVSGNEFESAINTFREKKGAMDDTCTRIKNTVEDLANTYKGDASNRFRAQFEEIYANLIKNSEAMENVISDLQKVSGTYSGTEDSNKTSFQAIDVGDAYL